MARPKGAPKPAGSGRKAGTQNKTTLAVKEALEYAFAGIGGAEALVKWARENQTQFYQLWGKLLPKEMRVEGSVITDVHIARRIVHTREEVGRLPALPEAGSVPERNGTH